MGYGQTKQNTHRGMKLCSSAYPEWSVCFNKVQKELYQPLYLGDPRRKSSEVRTDLDHLLYID